MNVTEKESKRIAGEILRQIGGSVFIKMTGAKGFICDGYTAGFKIPTGKNNVWKITLNSMDTYDIEIGTLRAGKYTQTKEIKGIYNDQLRGLFERETGLRTSLLEVYA